MKDYPPNPALLNNPEGKVLVFSLVLVAGLAAVISILSFLGTHVQLEHVLLGSLGFNVTGGRAPGIGIFTYFHYPVWLTIAYNLFLEVTIVSFMYSVLVLSSKKYIHIRLLDQVIARLQENALKNEALVRRYGWIGLAVFSMIPLPFTGPVLGSVIGYFLKFSIARTFSAVLLGSGIAVVAYAFGLRFLEEHLHIFRYVFLILFAVVLVYFSPTIYRFVKKVRKTS